MDIDRESLLIIVAVAALAPLLADLPKHIRVPVVVTEIVLGIIIGPQVLDIARTGPLLDMLSEFGLAFLFFLAGMEIDSERIRGRPAVLAARAWVVSLALGVSIGFALWAFGLVSGPVLVGLALATTALGALVPILKDAGVLDTHLGSHALATGAAGEFGPVVTLSLVLAALSGELWRTALLFAFAAVAIAVGLVALRARPARIVRLLSATMHSSGQFALRLSVLILAALVMLAGEFGLDIVLGAFAAGLIVGLVSRGEEAAPLHVKLDGIGYGFVIPIFFIATGIQFDLDALLSDPATLALVPGFALVFVLVRGGPTWLGYRNELASPERGALALLSAAALPLVVAITQVAVERGKLDETDAVALVGAAMLSLLVYPLIGLSLARVR